MVLGLPLEQVGASQRHAYLVLIVGLLLSLALGGGAALWLSRGIVRPIEQLRRAARLIGHGEEVKPSTAGPVELIEVSQALAAASRELRGSSSLRAMLLQREQEARAAAEKSSREKDEFLAMLSHELRNPLAAVSNAFELLRRLPHDSERAPTTREVIDRQLAHLRYLINDLLDVSRAMTGKISLTREHADVTACVRHALREATESGTLREHALRTDMESVGALLDRHRVQQVATNLLTNAARYSPPGSTITVSVRREGESAVLEIADEGIGMDQATRSRIFDLFYQGTVSQDRAHGGLGVGLTLTRRLVELHGGSIEAHSEGPGRGSRFVVRLPAVDATATLAEPPAGRSEALPPGSGRVLVVDDNRDHAESLAELLRLNGCIVAVAYDGEEALRVAAQSQPELVLLDLGLPKRDGYSVCRSLRALPGGEQLQIVALTGWGQESDRRKTREAGFDLHLTKPVRYEELLASIRRVPQAA